MGFCIDFPSLQCYIKPKQTTSKSKILYTPTVINTPMRMIECTSISDDFYSNLIDWSGHYIYYSVENTIYGYNFYTETCQKIFHSPSYNVTSVKCHLQNSVLCIGTSSGLLYLVDIGTGRSSRHLHHKSRIGVLELYNSNIITGSRDRKSKVIDLRIKMPVACLGSHFQEVCGLSLNSDSSFLASGGNDNKVFVFDMRESCMPFATLGAHHAAVKALSWCPNSSNQLITGGGTADKTIKHWDLSKTTPLVRSYDFESQICNLKWLRNNKILSTFGYSNDDIKLLHHFKPEKCYRGHKNRVIHFSVDESERFFVSGSSDSTIRFWSIDSPQSDVIAIR